VTRISVLLPVFDAEDTLASCLRSLLRQTERERKCVLVDDGRPSSTGGGRSSPALQGAMMTLSRCRIGAA
jgi:hypothetical protein